MHQEKHSVFVGISIRNKTLTPNQVYEISKYAIEKLGARRILFLIADELELINLRVFETGMAETLERQASKQYERLKNIIEQGTSLTQPERTNIVIDRWKSILNSEYWKSYITIFSKFIENNEFRSDIENIARRFAERRGESANDDELHYLSLYLLAEIPTLLSGVRYQQKWYRTMIYPVIGNEAIDEIAADLALGKYGQAPGLHQICQITKMKG